jgi:hypothetical protein
MKLPGFALLAAALMLAGCDTTEWPSGSAERARAHGNLYLPGPGHILRPADFALEVEASAVRGQTSPARNPNLVHVPLFVEGADYFSPVGPATPLYESRMHQPILAPDGHQVTLAEFNAPTGEASVKCLDHGTHVTLHVSGLIPNGVYTVWVLTFRAPGFDPTLSNLSAVGALGTPDGTRNVFTASSRGAGDITAITRFGPLSMLGSIGDCALTDEYEFHVVGAYQIDGQTYGPNLGPDGTAVEQFGFVFKRQ